MVLDDFDIKITAELFSFLYLSETHKKIHR